MGKRPPITNRVRELREEHDKMSQAALGEAVTDDLVATGAATAPSDVVDVAVTSLRAGRAPAGSGRQLVEAEEAEVLDG